MTHIDAEMLFDAIAAIDSELIEQSRMLPESKGTVVRKRILAISAAVILTAVFCGAAFAGAHIFEGRLSDEDMIASSADAYTERVNTAVKAEDIRVELTDVVSENNLLYVEFVFDVPEPEMVAGVCFAADSISISVDGRDALCHTGTVGKSPSDGVFYEVDDFDLELLRHSHGRNFDYFGIHDFDISFDCVQMMYKDGGMRWITGMWEYSFTYDVKDLSEKTVEYMINSEAVMSNGDRVLLEKIVATPISQRLVYYNCADNRTCHMIGAEAVDDMGNVLSFAVSEAIFGNHEDRFNIGLAVNENADSFSQEARVLEVRITVDETDGEERTERNTPPSEVFRAVRAE